MFTTDAAVSKHRPRREREKETEKTFANAQECMYIIKIMDVGRKTYQTRSEHDPMQVGKRMIAGGRTKRGLKNQNFNLLRV